MSICGPAGAILFHLREFRLGWPFRISLCLALFSFLSSAELFALLADFIRLGISAYVPRLSRICKRHRRKIKKRDCERKKYLHTFIRLVHAVSLI